MSELAAIKTVKKYTEREAAELLRNAFLDLNNVKLITDTGIKNRHISEF